MITYKENAITTEGYLELRAAVNWPVLSYEQAEKALQNSLYTICAYQDNQPIGMGRLVGDGSVICYVQDLIVLPDTQHCGIGSYLLEHLIEAAGSFGFHDTTMMLGLMCAKGREPFYESRGFLSRPTDALGPGMIQYLSL